MMGALVDITGKRYGRLVAIEPAGRDARGKVIWKCTCDCGADHIAASSNLRSGQVKSCGCLIADMKGESHPGWKGEKALYSAKHMWVHQAFGKAEHCEFNAAHTGRFEWSNISGQYKRARSDWQQLCVPCHRNYDAAKRGLPKQCRAGHVYAITGVFVINGQRRCKVCKLQDNAKHYARVRRLQNSLEDAA